ncbi:MAG: FmdB family transcriptional regulator [Actinomycetota bacterium]|nr:FmdB family transcriptional regulator [Actinomycetota bacterium]
MPTYVYKFIDTGETIEVQQSFSDDALTEAVHPSTGATMPVKKVFLPVGVTFKGGGFYKTDSRGKSSSTTPSSSGSSSESSSSSSSSSDSGSSSSSTPAPAAASTPAASSSSSGSKSD